MRCKKNEIGLSFSFFNFPRREGNGIRIHFMLSVFRFAIALKKTDFDFLFLFRFSFFVFVWNLENGLQVVSPFFCFLYPNLKGWAVVYEVLKGFVVTKE